MAIGNRLVCLSRAEYTPICLVFEDSPPMHGIHEEESIYNKEHNHLSKAENHQIDGSDTSPERGWCDLCSV